MVFSDQEIQTMIIGTWNCTDSNVPHRITFNKDGKLRIVMTVHNLLNPMQLLGTAVKFFSGDVCEGNYHIGDGKLTVNLGSVPNSWLNTEVAGIGLAIGDMLVKLYGTIYTASKQSQFTVTHITDNDMELTSYWDKGNKNQIKFEKL